MEEHIYNTDTSFDFNSLHLAKPQPFPGGNYFMRLTVSGKPLYIQPPKCIMKQGFAKSGKKYYSDFMFSNENTEFIEWMEKIETYCQDTIYKNSSDWFEDKMDMGDIENYFTSPLKIYKSGKFYNLRVNIALNLGKPLIKIYNENEEQIDFQDLKENTNILSILEIKGIKCSATSFQIEFDVKQIMTVQVSNLFEKCLFNRKPAVIAPILSKPEPINETIINNQSPEVELDVKTEDETEELNDTEVIVEDVSEDETTNESLQNNNGNEMNENSSEEDKNEMKLIENNLEKNAQENTNDVIEINEESLEKKTTNELEEINFTLDKINEDDTFKIKDKNNVYYEMYKEAKKKAKIARDLALSSILEAKRIKNTYMLEDVTDSDEDSSDIEFLDQ
tara:strand:- start:604 stop:1779 length:1176 start_codon:yes stop_codon:yes gene_type:complete